jgi:hypothetical protein
MKISGKRDTAGYLQEELMHGPGSLEEELA